MHRRLRNTRSKRHNNVREFPCIVFTELLKGVGDVMTKEFESVPEAKKIKKPVAKRPTNDVRFDKLDHWPKSAKYQRCKYCKNGFASTVCIKCKVNLCYVKNRNCFLAYHKNP